MPIITIRTPVCFLCHRAADIALPAAAATALAAGAAIQDVLPHLPRSEREQLISGIHPPCWSAAFGDESASE